MTGPLDGAEREAAASSGAATPLDGAEREAAASSGAATPLDGAEREAAAASGVATSYENWAHQVVDVPADAVRAALAALGGPPAPGPAPTLVTRDGTPPEPGTVRLEGGGVLGPGVRVPHGYHLLERADGSVATLISAPPAMPAVGPGRTWGWAVQLYAMRSARSWGAGDYADLATVAEAVAAQGADVLLVNPLHALTPVVPVEISPYSPSSRRFANPAAIAVDALPEYAAASAPVRARVDALQPPTRPVVDHDEVFAAKAAALELLAPPAPGLPADDDPLLGWALFAALAERLGPDWRAWPAELHRPGPAATAAADPARVAFHAWVQRRCAEQLRAAQDRALAAGMRVGIVHDLAVGVHPGGADAWALAGELVRGVTVGAPPDSFNQLGQDWSLPPFHPRALAETGYRAFREVVRATLRHAGGIRVDHVMGLWRLWWVPEGGSGAHGTYVHYDADAMLAVLALEAERAGAVVIGEDLGTVEAAVARRMDGERLLGCDVLWFETDPDDDLPLPPQRWRQDAVASISTHDLPTAYGWLSGEPVRVRHELGLLGLPVAEEERRMAGERDRWLALLRDERLVGAAPSADEVVLALHALLAATPCRIVLAAFGDATGDVRQPNMPGTVPRRDAYPSWCLPVADGDGVPLGLEELLAHPGVARIARMFRDAGRGRAVGRIG